MQDCVGKYVYVESRVSFTITFTITIYNAPQ